MSDAMKICGGALIAAVCAFLLRELGWRGAVAFSAVALALFFGILADGLSVAAGGISEIAAEYGVGEIAKEILKTVGVTYIFGICSDICAELGERSLSSALDAVGRVEILLIAMPYFIKVLRSAAELVG